MPSLQFINISYYNKLCYLIIVGYIVVGGWGRVYGME